MKKATLLIMMLALSILLCACSAATTEIKAMLDDGLTEQQRQAVVAAIKELPGAEEAEYVSAEAAFAEFMEGKADDPAFADITPEDLSDRVVITVKTEDASSLGEQISQIDGVARVTQVKVPSGFALFGVWLQSLVQ